jgi:lipoprotein-releasing system permease protein
LYKLFLTVRYLRKRRIAYFAIAAVTLCVAMVLIVMSIMGGWLDEVKQRARGLLGDIIVDNAAYSGFPLYQEFIDEISVWPEIAKATPVIYTYGLYEFQGTTRNGMVRAVGIRLQDVYEVNAFKKSLFYEKHYPGTTTLAPQQQPIIGIDLEAPPIAVPEEDRLFLRPRLPEAYQLALDRARAEGASDQESTETALNHLLNKIGLPPIPGVYEGPLGPEEGPRMEGSALPGIIVGRDMFAYRESDGSYTRPENVPRGCKVLLTVAPVSANATIDTPVKKAFRYADDSRTGIYEIDSQHVYCDFELLQQIVQMDEAERVDPNTLETIGTVPARCSQIQLKVTPGVDVSALCRRLEATYHGYVGDPRFELDAFESRLSSSVKALTWQESQAHIIAPVEKEKVLVTIILAIVSMVAFFLILCILYMIVLQKTRDIGIIKSIGGSSGGVAFIFIFYGAAVGIAGSILGTILGTLFVTYINEIQDFLIQINPAWRVWDMQVYSFDRIPDQVNPWEAAGIVLVAMIASTIGSLAAAVRAGFMEPVKALSYE